VLSTTPLRIAALSLIAITAAFLSGAAAAEDGHDLWLRYRPLPASSRHTYARAATAIVADRERPTIAVAAAELERGLAGLLARPVLAATLRDGAILLKSTNCAPLGAFSLRSTRSGGYHVTVISGCGDVGTLYGAFALLRRIQTHRNIEHLDIRDAPKLPLRMLDHWDNLDGTVERG
jgi:alpha-glucuronidase